MRFSPFTAFLGSRPERLPAALIALTLSGLVLAGCHGKSNNANAAGPTATATSAVPQATQVSVTPARLQSISDNIIVTGVLNSLDDVTLGVKAAGKIVAVYAREGDVVHDGQIVVQQDTADLQAQLDQQRANLFSEQSKLQQAELAYKDALTNLSLTQDQTASAIKLAQAGLESAREEAAVVKQGARTQERQQAEDAVTGAKADRDSASADQASAAADRDKARSDLKRYQNLFRQDAVSAQELDQAQATADSAEARYNSAVSRYNSMTAKYNSAVQAQSLTQEGSRPEDIRRAQAAVEQARQTLITAQANRNQVILRRADIENARAGILAAQASVRQAQAAVRLSEQALRDTSIRSPITGMVAERKVEPGMQVAVAKPDVMRIVALDAIYFDAQLAETQYSEVQFGQTVDVTIDALPGRHFRGTVSKIFPVASSTSRSFTARVRLQNEGHLLRPQMFARGVITVAIHPNALVVTREALLDVTGNSAQVFVAENNIAIERAVRTGITEGDRVEILSGLKPGDKVITMGQGQIQNKDKIQVIPTPGATSSDAANSTPPGS